MCRCLISFQARCRGDFMKGKVHLGSNSLESSVQFSQTYLIQVNLLQMHWSGHRFPPAQIFNNFCLLNTTFCQHYRKARCRLLLPLLGRVIIWEHLSVACGGGVMKGYGWDYKRLCTMQNAFLNGMSRYLQDEQCNCRKPNINVKSLRNQMQKY